MSLLAVAALAAGPAIAQDQDQQIEQAPEVELPPVQDESLLAKIRIAARGGDFNLARQRRDELKGTPRLWAKGGVALGLGYLEHGDAATADEVLRKALEAATYSEGLTSYDRVSALLYAADALHSREEYRGLADEAFNGAVGFANNLTFIEYDLAVMELAIVGRRLGQDPEDLRSVLETMSNASLRDKLIEQLGLDGG
ncbi:MAG: hypothetical protein ISN26_04395 [Betaproteobacteria bacterium AqS2]|uniref:Tetratricopeptide repeat protein n=1 Tax=Candidatus Amphirhobacter heronislandensis TaxID=1732024 RepID=A0A930Y1F5_9GAMM|nr:hypothetical protein [Betaproteobacteria bacterium AqS2]